MQHGPLPGRSFELFGCGFDLLQKDGRITSRVMPALLASLPCCTSWRVAAVSRYSQQIPHSRLHSSKSQKPQCFPQHDSHKPYDELASPIAKPISGRHIALGLRLVLPESSHGVQSRFERCWLRCFCRFPCFLETSGLPFRALIFRASETGRPTSW